MLHYIYLTGLEAYEADAAKPDAKLSKKHFEGCQNLHQHWDSLFWDEEMGFELVKKHYSWFVPVWEGYDGWGKQVGLSSDLSNEAFKLCLGASSVPTLMNLLQCCLTNAQVKLPDVERPYSSVHMDPGPHLERCHAA